MYELTAKGEKLLEDISGKLGEGWWKGVGGRVDPATRKIERRGYILGAVRAGRDPTKALNVLLGIGLPSSRTTSALSRELESLVKSGYVNVFRSSTSTVELEHPPIKYIV